MIATITGEITQVLEGQIVLSVSGIGWLLSVTEETCQACRTGKTKAFHTYLVVREDNLALYGFETAEERDLFVHLIGVTGVGPKIALASLSTLSPKSVRQAIAGDQPEIFVRVPGIGKKTAQKIILDLQGKVEPLEPLEAISRLDEVDTEVIEALTALGYSVVEAQAAVQSMGKNEGENAEERLRKALQFFG
ncbi:Holliday junction branch migration protein RuvA [bacterium]|nr:Holliday junction branch migration protein RuvA [bacterium]